MTARYARDVMNINQKNCQSKITLRKQPWRCYKQQQHVSTIQKHLCSTPCLQAWYAFQDSRLRSTLSLSLRTYTCNFAHLQSCGVETVASFLLAWENKQVCVRARSPVGAVCAMLSASTQLSHPCPQLNCLQQLHCFQQLMCFQQRCCRRQLWWHRPLDHQSGKTAPAKPASRS